MNCTESDSTHLISILKIIPQVHVTPNLPNSILLLSLLKQMGLTPIALKNDENYILYLKTFKLKFSRWHSSVLSFQFPGAKREPLLETSITRSANTVCNRQVL
ncbi:unnamed protein product [Sphagnum compactum]